MLAPGAVAVLVELVRVEQDAARGFDAPLAAAGPRADLDLLGLMPSGQQFVDQLDGWPRPRGPLRPAGRRCS